MYKTKLPENSLPAHRTQLLLGIPVPPLPTGTGSTLRGSAPALPSSMLLKGQQKGILYDPRTKNPHVSVRGEQTAAESSGESHPGRIPKNSCLLGAKVGITPSPAALLCTMHHHLLFNPSHKTDIPSLPRPVFLEDLPNMLQHSQALFPRILLGSGRQPELSAIPLFQKLLHLCTSSQGCNCSSLGGLELTDCSGKTGIRMGEKPPGL